MYFDVLLTGIKETFGHNIKIVIQAPKQNKGLLIWIITYLVLLGLSCAPNKTHPHVAVLYAEGNLRDNVKCQLTSLWKSYYLFLKLFNLCKIWASFIRIIFCFYSYNKKYAKKIQKSLSLSKALNPHPRLSKGEVPATKQDDYLMHSFGRAIPVY